MTPTTPRPAEAGQATPAILLAFANDWHEDRRYLPHLIDESKAIASALAPLAKAGALEVLPAIHKATLQEVLRQLREHRDAIRIFHFAGHASGSTLLFEDAAGDPAAAHANGLAAYLGGQPGLVLVFLNGCATEAQVQRLRAAGVKAVVATTQAIADDVATEFAAAFYAELVARPLREAFDAAVHALGASRGDRAGAVLRDVTEDDAATVPGSSWRLACASEYETWTPTEVIGTLEERARQASEAGDLEQAIALGEEVVAKHEAAGDRRGEARMRSFVFMALNDSVAAGSASPAKVIDRMTQQLDALARLDAGEHELALDRAALARVRRDPEQALAWSRMASTAAHDATSRRDALISLLGDLASLEIDAEIHGLAGEVAAARESATNADRLLLDTTWLEVRACIGDDIASDVDILCAWLRAADTQLTIRSLHILERFLHQLDRNNQAPLSFAVGETVYARIAQLGGGAAGATSQDAIPAPLCVRIALGQASRAATLDREAMRTYLGHAENHHHEAEAVDPTFTQRRPFFLLDRASILLAAARRCEEATNVDSLRTLFDDIERALSEAERLATSPAHSSDTVRLRASVAWLRGDVDVERGNPRGASRHYRSVRSDAVMARPDLIVDLGHRSSLHEAHALRLAGDLQEARALIQQLLVASDLPARLRALAESEAALIDQVLPVQSSIHEHRRSGNELFQVADLHRQIAERLEPLVSFWEVWRDRPGEDAPAAWTSSILDFLGRGGFAGIAACIATDPGSVIAVDARSVDDIAHAARVFAPLFETVLVKWKGELLPGFTLTPVPRDFHGIGGHGYLWSSSVPMDGWVFAGSWANRIPEAVTQFLARDGLPLVRTGRLLVVPAPLVGCTQTAIGWTDDLLLDGMLGGAFDAVQPVVPQPSRQRVIDLCELSIPFIRDASLADLAAMLDDNEDHVRALRRVLRRAMSARDLRDERWQGIHSLQQDAREALQLLDDRYTQLARHGHGTVERQQGAVSVGQRGAPRISGEPVTGMLQSLAHTRPDVSPWIPYWRLRHVGGELRWGCPIDNRSTPPVKPSRQDYPTMQSWLHPAIFGVRAVFFR